MHKSFKIIINKNQNKLPLTSLIFPKHHGNINTTVRNNCMQSYHDRVLQLFFKTMESIKALMWPVTFILICTHFVICSYFTEFLLKSSSKCFKSIYLVIVNMFWGVWSHNCKKEQYKIVYTREKHIKFNYSIFHLWILKYLAQVLFAKLS